MGYPKFQVWQLLTYGFMHGSVAHLFFNMFALFMFGSDIERLFGSRRYLIYYLTCVIGAALMHLIVVIARGSSAVADGRCFRWRVRIAAGVRHGFPATHADADLPAHSDARVVVRDVVWRLRARTWA